VPALLPAPMTAGVPDDEDENQETKAQQYNHVGSIFPDLLKSIGELGPIHYSRTAYITPGKK